MRFKEFIDLTETGTSTADIAGFSRICIPLVRRMYPNEIDIGFGKNTKRTKVTYRVPQLDESLRGDLVNKSRLVGDLVNRQPRTDEPKVGDVYKSDSGQVYEVINLDGKNVYTILKASVKAKANFPYDQFLAYIKQGRLIRVY